MFVVTIRDWLSLWRWWPNGISANDDGMTGIHLQMTGGHVCIRKRRTRGVAVPIFVNACSEEPKAGEPDVILTFFEFPS